jgi:hypothetical protein
MSKNQKAILALLVGLVLVGFVYLNPPKAQANDHFVTEQETIMAITAASQTVVQPVLPQRVDVTLEPHGSDVIATVVVDDRCHVNVPEGTTLETMGKLQALLTESGCNVKSWWTTVDIPFFGSQVVDN